MLLGILKSVGKIYSINDEIYDKLWPVHLQLIEIEKKVIELVDQIDGPVNFRESLEEEIFSDHLDYLEIDK